MLPIASLLLAALTAVQGGNDSTRTAPDGHPGLGAQTPLSELLSFVRSGKDDDRAFFSSLRALSSEVRVLAATTGERYRKQGYCAVVDAKQEATIDALYAAFAAIDADPFPHLLGDAAVARTIARMLLDTRLRARKTVLEGWDFEMHELDSGLAVLQGATDGFVELNQAEASNIAARIDLSASLLRAMRNDLTVLKPGDADPQADRATDEAVEHLIAVATASEGEGVRRAAVVHVVEDARALAARMESSLFTPRLVAKLSEQLDWRARLFDECKPLREEVMLWLPDTEQGRAAPPDIAKLARFERMRHVAWKGRVALSFDPLDEDCVFATAHALDFQNGLIESRPFYDRFLALRHIRAHDDRTIHGRELDAREREALDAVQRSPLPAPGRPPARF
jgi:hypothetical protein